MFFNTSDNSIENIRTGGKIMSYSDAMRYANEVERGVEMEIYRREMEQQEYEEELS